jgi:tripartite ATP-independent transporter DctM subunit
MTLLLLALMLAAMFGALFTGMPAMLAIGGAPLVVALVASLFGLFDPTLLQAFPSRVYGIMESGSLAAIPLFVLKAAILDHSGVAARMLAAMSELAGGSPRRLGLAVLAVAALLAASTGLVGATIIILATIAMPGMLKAGVGDRQASGLVMACGTLGQIMPPSILLILLAELISNASAEAARRSGSFAVIPVTVSDLFAAAILPALVLVCLYALWILLTFGRAAAPARSSSNVDTMRLFRTFAPPLILILCVLGSILAGIATPTESASVGVLGAALLAIFSRDRPPLLAIARRAGLDTARLTGVIFSIVVASSLFTLVLRGFGGDMLVEQGLLALPGEAGVALLVVLAVVFLLGLVLEFVEIATIVVPIAGPVLFALGVDPLWFAILLAVNLQTSFLSPPVGLSLFYFRSAAPASISTATMWRSVVPYIAMQLVAVIAVWLFPTLATWLPQALR